ncbi:MAG: hypothetical protein ABJH98_15710 [Reichenbachiella sp.]|uniref:outer membrane beta-barrel protein n=1 Tax=Reichenbachiella sp. TaxID=2184521 RepID=UPI003298291E
MKQYILIFFLATLGIFNLHGQAIELSGYGGYMLSGESNYYDGEIDIYDGPVFGGTLGYDLGNGIQVQFLYNRNSTDGRVVYYRTLNPEVYNVDVVIEQFHLGAEKVLGGNEMLIPYGALSLGVGAYTPKNIEPSGHELDAVTRFSMGAGLGVKIFPTEKIGIKLQAKMFMPLMFSGVGVFCGTGGCGGGTSFYVPIVHGEFSGGVVFRIDK